MEKKETAFFSGVTCMCTAAAAAATCSSGTTT